MLHYDQRPRHSSSDGASVCYIHESGVRSLGTASCPASPSTPSTALREVGVLFVAFSQQAERLMTPRYHIEPTCFVPAGSSDVYPGTP